jgi:hypothetical protein
MPAVVEPVILRVSALVGSRHGTNADADQLHARSAPVFSSATPPYRFRSISRSAAAALWLALGMVAGLSVLGCPAAAQQFSGDLVATQAADRPAVNAGKESCTPPTAPSASKRPTLRAAFSW